MTRRCSFTSHSCRPLVTAPGTGRKSATCSPWKRRPSALVGTKTRNAFSPVFSIWYCRLAATFTRASLTVACCRLVTCIHGSTCSMPSDRFQGV